VGLYPARVDLHVVQGDTQTITLQWSEPFPEGTYVATVATEPPTPIPLTIDGQAMTLTMVDALDLPVGRWRWRLRDELADRTLIEGRLRVTDRASACGEQTGTIAVVVDSATVEVAVALTGPQGPAGPAGPAGDGSGTVSASDVESDLITLTVLYDAAAT
jgi:hypothetical protein